MLANCLSFSKLVEGLCDGSIKCDPPSPPMSRARRSVAAAADVTATSLAGAEATAATAAVAVTVHTDVGAAPAAPELLTAAANG